MQSSRLLGRAALTLNNMIDGIAADGRRVLSSNGGYAARSLLGSSLRNSAIGAGVGAVNGGINNDGNVGGSMLRGAAGGAMLGGLGTAGLGAAGRVYAKNFYKGGLVGARRGLAFQAHSLKYGKAMAPMGNVLRSRAMPLGLPSDPVQYGGVIGLLRKSKGKGLW
jgi:hypothetical protein